MKQKNLKDRISGFVILTIFSLISLYTQGQVIKSDSLVCSLVNLDSEKFSNEKNDTGNISKAEAGRMLSKAFLNTAGKYITAANALSQATLNAAVAANALSEATLNATGNAAVAVHVIINWLKEYQQSLQTGDAHNQMLRQGTND